MDEKASENAWDAKLQKAGLSEQEQDWAGAVRQLYLERQSDPLTARPLTLKAVVELLGRENNKKVDRVKAWELLNEHPKFKELLASFAMIKARASKQLSKVPDVKSSKSDAAAAEPPHGAVKRDQRASVRRSTKSKILQGAGEIGITDIQSNRTDKDNLLGQNLLNATHIRIFGVSGQHTIDDYGRQLESALRKDGSLIRIIFSTNDDYVIEASKRKDIESRIIENCDKLQGYLRQARQEAKKDGRLGGDIQIALFPSYNRLPHILCNHKFGAFHIKVPGRTSEAAPYFELGQKSPRSSQVGKSLLDEFISNFDANWAFLERQGLVDSIDKYSALLRRWHRLGNGNLSDRQGQLTADAHDYYNEKMDDRNLALAQNDLLVNHHFGIGEVANLDALHDQDEIAEKLHRLELNQIDILISKLGILGLNDKVLDVGCGRGGTAFSIYDKFKCPIVGINISERQVEQAKAFAEKRCAKDVSFEVMNFHDLKLGKLGDEHFTHAVLNEITMYSLDLNSLLEGVARYLSPKGRLVLATWCMDGEYSEQAWARRINGHYVCAMHVVKELEDTLEQNYLPASIKIDDQSHFAVHYFKLRKKWKLISEIEDCFLDGYKDGKLRYLYATAIKRDETE